MVLRKGKCSNKDSSSDGDSTDIDLWFWFALDWFCILEKKHFKTFIIFFLLYWKLYIYLTLLYFTLLYLYLFLLYYITLYSIYFYCILCFDYLFYSMSISNTETKWFF